MIQKSSLLIALLYPISLSCMTRDQAIFAARNDDTKNLARYLAEGHTVDETDAKGYTLLFAAASSRAIRSAKFLHDRGAHVDHANSDGETPLFRAASGGPSLMTAWLLSQGASASATDSYGRNALHMAASTRFSCAELVHQQLVYGSDGDSTAEITALLLTHIVKMRRRAGIPNDGLLPLDPVNQQDRNGNTPLHIATNGQPHLVWLLLSQQAGHFKNKYGETPLMRAKQGGQWGIIKMMRDWHKKYPHDLFESEYNQLHREFIDDIDDAPSMEAAPCVKVWRHALGLNDIFDKGIE